MSVRVKELEDQEGHSCFVHGRHALRIHSLEIDDDRGFTSAIYICLQCMEELIAELSKAKDADRYQSKEGEETSPEVDVGLRKGY